MAQTREQVAYRLPGFSNPGRQAQQVFRTLLEAQSHPGRIMTLATVPTCDPIYPATMALLLALVDYDTSLWLDTTADSTVVREHLRFHCGCPLIAEPHAAQFAVIANPSAMPALSEFAQGSDEYPEQSATLIIQVESVTGADGWQLTGPGIEAKRRLQVVGLPTNITVQLRQNHAQFPCGVDLILIHNDRLVALPRTTRVSE